MSMATQDGAPGYRRRILIEPAPGCVSAELEDDYHRMVVTLSHDALGIITQVDSAMKRSPWTTCPGAIAQLEATFMGRPLAEVVGKDEKVRNCTHLFDLATFAAGHAGESAPVTYDIEVSDPEGGVMGGATRARLWRDGISVYDWTYEGGIFTAPSDMGGLPMKEIGRWIAAQPNEMQESAKILRWASMVAMGRLLLIPSDTGASRFANGACYNFQPDMASIGRRRPGAAVDFSAIGVPALADRKGMFAPHG